MRRHDKDLPIGLILLIASIAMLIVYAIGQWRFTWWFPGQLL